MRVLLVEDNERLAGAVAALIKKLEEGSAPA